MNNTKYLGNGLDVICGSKPKWKLPLINAPFHNIPAENEAYDYILSIEAIGYKASSHDELKKQFPEIERVLKVGGTAYIGLRASMDNFNGGIYSNPDLYIQYAQSNTFIQFEPQEGNYDIRKFLPENLKLDIIPVQYIMRAMYGKTSYPVCMRLTKTYRQDYHE